MAILTHYLGFLMSLKKDEVSLIVTKKKHLPKFTKLSWAQDILRYYKKSPTYQSIVDAIGEQWLINKNMYKRCYLIKGGS